MYEYENYTLRIYLKKYIYQIKHTFKFFKGLSKFARSTNKPSTSIGPYFK